MKDSDIHIYHPSSTTHPLRLTSLNTVEPFPDGPDRHNKFKMGSIQQNAMEYLAPPVEVTFDGFLFDMDGTIIDSTSAVVKHWEA